MFIWACPKREISARALPPPSLMARPLGHTQYILRSTCHTLVPSMTRIVVEFRASHRRVADESRASLSWRIRGKNKIKAERLLFFLVGHNFYMSEDSLTVKYTESGLNANCILLKRWLSYELHQTLHVLTTHVYQHEEVVFHNNTLT